jgi:2,3-bisphosphoglycerate-dependent phosphoglycerate mutase
MTTAAGASERRGRLFLVRHGQSTFNAENQFTGWLDPTLTRVGEAEAKTVAQRLWDAGIKLDAAFSSAFRRTIRSTELILEGLGSDVVPKAAAELNERDYGDLTGLNKAEAAAQWGEAQIRIWRRSYAVPPPRGESLKDTVARAAPFYLREILPLLLGGATVLVVSHGNTLRALVTALYGLSPDEVEALEIATGEILAFDIAPDARPGRCPVFMDSPQEPATADKKDKDWMLEVLEEDERAEHGLPAGNDDNKTPAEEDAGKPAPSERDA